MFRIINLTNKNTNLSSLNGLREIWKTIDLKNISRLKTTEDLSILFPRYLPHHLEQPSDTKVKVDEEGKSLMNQKIVVKNLIW